jgi:WD40 repeat protein
MDTADHPDELAVLRMRVAELEDRLEAARVHALEARASELASAAQVEIERGSHTLALLLALSAVRSAAPLERPPVAVRLALRRALECIPPMRWRGSTTDNGVFLAWSPDGHILAIGENSRFEAPRDLISLWDVAAWQEVGCLPLDVDPGALVPYRSVGAEVQLSQEIYLGGIQSLRWSPNGRWLLIGRSDGAALLWDPTADAPPHALPGPGVAGLEDDPFGEWQLPIIAEVGWSHGGARLLVGYEYGYAQLWDTASGELLWELPDDPEIWVTSPSPDAHLLATGSDGGVIAIWDTATGALRNLLRDSGEAITHLSWSLDGTRLVSCDETGRGNRAVGSPRVQLWDVQTGALLHTLPGSLDTRQSAPWSHDGTQVFTFDAMALLQIWDAATGRRTQTLPLASDWSFPRARWSPDGNALLLDSVRRLEIWDVRTGTRLHTLPAPDLLEFAWSPDGRRVSAVVEWQVCVWDVATRQPSLLLAAPQRDVRDVIWTDEGPCAIQVASREGSYRLQAAAMSGSAIGLPVDTPDPPVGVFWRPDGRRALLQVAQEAAGDGTASFHSRLLAWDIAKGTTRELTRGSSLMSAISWSPDCRRYAMAWGGSLQIRDAVSDEELRGPEQEQGRWGYLSGLAWSPDSTRLLLVWRVREDPSGPEAMHVQIWEAEYGLVSHRVTVGDQARLIFLGAGWGPEGPQLLTADGRSASLLFSETQAAVARIRLWDLVHGAPIWQIDGLSCRGDRASWSPDGRQILVEGKGLISIVDTATGAVRQILEPDEHQVIALWSPDSRQILTCQRFLSNGRAQIWIVSPELLYAELTRRVCERLGDNPAQPTADVLIRDLIPDWRGSNVELDAIAEPLIGYMSLSTGN